MADIQRARRVASSSMLANRSARVASESVVEVPSAEARLLPVRVRIAGGSAKPGTSKLVFQIEAVDDPAVAVREKAKKQLRVTESLKLAEAQGMPDWVSVDASKLEGVFKKAPDRDSFGSDIKEALIVELYSR